MYFITTCCTEHDVRHIIFCACLCITNCKRIRTTQPAITATTSQSHTQPLLRNAFPLGMRKACSCKRPDTTHTTTKQRHRCATALNHRARACALSAGIQISTRRKNLFERFQPAATVCRRTALHRRIMLCARCLPLPGPVCVCAGRQT